MLRASEPRERFSIKLGHGSDGHLNPRVVVAVAD